MNARQSLLAVASLICTLGAPSAWAGCNAEVALLYPGRVAFTDSYYDDPPRQDAGNLVQWYPGDPSTFSISLNADFQRTPPQPSAADLMAALERAEVHVLAGGTPRDALEALVGGQGVAFLAAPPPGALIPCKWSRSAPQIGERSEDRSTAWLELTLLEPRALPDGSYWVVASLPLAPDGSLGCSHERGSALFFDFVRLIVGPPQGLRERAFREYRDLLQAQWSAATGADVDESPSARIERVAHDLGFALDAAKRLVDIDRSSSFGWEMLAKVHEVRHEAVPAIAAYRKAAELLTASVPDIAKLPPDVVCINIVVPRPTRLQQRIDALSLPQPIFADWP